MRNRAFVAASLLAVIFMTACSSGEAPSSAVFANSSGEIVGFGSVIVNGIEFTRRAGLADDRVSLGFDNVSGVGEDRLQIGMVVRIRGTFDSATGKGEYEAIEFQPELRGQLDGVNETARTVTVMGRTVQLEAGSQLVGIRNLAELTADLGVGRHPELEISGYLDNSGILHATRISKAAPNFVNSGRVEIKGTITSVGPGVFTIGTVTVNTAGATFAKMTAQDIAVGLLVDVKGAFDITTNTIATAGIERKQAVEGQVNDSIQIKGLAAGAVSNNTFTLNGPNGAITVKSAATAFFKSGLAATPAIVTAGTKLNVEGSLDTAGAIVATKVSVEIDKTVKLRGSLGAKDGTALTVTVNGVTVAVAPATSFIDNSSLKVSPFTLADLQVNDNVEVAGLVTAAGKIIATQIQRFDLPADRTFVQGIVSATAANTMTILGITVTVGAGTRFTKSDGNLFPGGQAAFISAIVPNVAVVKVEGTFIGPGSLDAANGTAEFEQVQ